MTDNVFQVKVMLRDKQTINCTVSVHTTSMFTMRIAGIELGQNEFTARDMFGA